PSRSQALLPDSPRRLVLVPQLIEIQVLAIRVHGVEEAVMTVGLELPFGGQALERLPFEDAIVVRNEIEKPTIENEVACTDPAVQLSLPGKSRYRSVRIQFSKAKTRDGAHGGHRGRLPVRLVKFKELGDVHVGQAITVRDHERVILDVLLHALNAPARHGVETGIREGHPEILLLVGAVVENLMQATQVDGDIAVHSLVIEEVLLNHSAAIPKTENEVAVPVLGEEFHDVPEDGFAAHIDER